jgi:hypothetical protein
VRRSERRVRPDPREHEPRQAPASGASGADRIDGGDSLAERRILIPDVAKLKADSQTVSQQLPVGGDDPNVQRDWR